MIRSVSEAAANELSMDRELADCVRRLDVAGVRRALQAGLRQGRSLPKAVIEAEGPPPGADVDALRFAVLQLLHELGLLDKRRLSNVMLLALQHSCGPSVVQWLLNAGVDVAGEPPPTKFHSQDDLSWLRRTYRTDVMRLLVAAGASVTIRFDLVVSSGRIGRQVAADATLLHDFAALPRGEPGISRVLVEAGIDVNCLSADRKTPLDCALGWQHCWSSARTQPWGKAAVGALWRTSRSGCTPAAVSSPACTERARRAARGGNPHW